MSSSLSSFFPHWLAWFFRLKMSYLVKNFLIKILFSLFLIKSTRDDEEDEPVGGRELFFCWSIFSIFFLFFQPFFSQTTRQKYVETILVNHDRINAGRIAEVKFSVLDHASGLSKMGLLDIREGSRESSDTKIVMCGFTKIEYRTVMTVDSKRLPFYPIFTQF